MASALNVLPGEWTDAKVRRMRNGSVQVVVSNRKVTDRAQRYRANALVSKTGKKCQACGSRRYLVVDHKDGHEENTRKSNLRVLCKSCNTRLGAAMAREGVGRRTRQYNPKSGGAQTLGEYVQAVLEHRRGAHDAGGKVIHATPKALRREYAAAIWGTRLARSRDSVPF